MNELTETRLQVGDMVGNKYRIVRQLGGGGSGVVFEAENTWTTLRVALKVLHAAAAAEVDSVRRFQFEARTATQLAHANIMRVLDMDRDARTGAFYIVQELLTGRDLRSELDAQGGHLAPRAAMEVMVPVMSALAAAHDKGVVHRDVKPENIYLSVSDDGRVTPKLIDFGVSKALATERTLPVTAHGALMGTVRYMPPEQVHGAPDVDARVDVWAVGAVLFEALTGKAPFEAPTETGLIVKIISTVPPPLATVAPDIPAAVCAMVDHALQPDRAKRFDTMKRFHDEARAWLDGQARGSQSIPARARSSRVLLVDDDEPLRRAVKRSLSRYEVTDVADGADALALLDVPDRFDLVLTDLNMPRVSGMEVVAAAVRVGVPVIMMTASSSLDNAVQAMRLGAVNFIPKPASQEAIRAAITDVLAAAELSRASREGVVGRDPGLRLVLDQVDLLADTDATVLITGESGTGRSLITKLLHRLSRRGDRPFVEVNVSAVPEKVLEADLFGVAARGADVSEVAGQIAAADGGTLVLDELGGIPSGCQRGVLTLVQDHAYCPVGAGRSRKVDLRILATAGEDIEERVKRRELREELYYRMSVVSLRVPPLRERVGDIPDLVEHFVTMTNAQTRRPVSGVTDEALEALRAWGWPGNVRELEIVVTRAVLLNRTGRVTLDDLPRELRAAR